MKIIEFNPEKSEIHYIPGYLIRLEDSQMVAYSRLCPKGCRYLNYMPKSKNCGCAPTEDRCCCATGVNNPVSLCPCCLSVFDLALDGCVVRGPAPCPPREFALKFQGDTVEVVC